MKQQPTDEELVYWIHDQSKHSAHGLFDYAADRLNELVRINEEYRQQMEAICQKIDEMTGGY